jgi:hypothetical protein
MMSDQEVQPAAELKPGLSQWQRVSNTFMAPSKTFEDIKNGRASWWLPFLLFVIVGTGLWTTVTYKVTWPTIVDNGLRMSPKQAERLDQVPADQREVQKKYSAIGQKYFWLLAPAFVLLMNVIAAGVLLGTINFGFGGKAKFGQVLAVSWYERAGRDRQRRPGEIRPGAGSQLVRRFTRSDQIADRRSGPVCRCRRRVFLARQPGRHQHRLLHGSPTGDVNGSLEPDDDA